MAELTQKERLQPSLLDRLTDDSPTERNESRDARVLSLKKLRECVLRDLTWLLNTESFESVVNLDSVPAVKSSSLNYGIPTVAGLTASGLELAKLERQVKNSQRGKKTEDDEDSSGSAKSSSGGFQLLRNVKASEYSHCRMGKSKWI